MLCEPLKKNHLTHTHTHTGLPHPRPFSIRYTLIINTHILVTPSFSLILCVCVCVCWKVPMDKGFKMFVCFLLLTKCTHKTQTHIYGKMLHNTLDFSWTFVCVCVFPNVLNCEIVSAAVVGGRINLC